MGQDWIYSNGNRPFARQQRRTHVDRVQAVRYSIGMLAGVLVIRKLRKWACQLPGVGVFLAPLTALMPLTLIGAGAGAAALYCYDEGDIHAIERKLLPKAKQHVQKAHKEVAATVGEVRGQLRDLQRAHEDAMRQLERVGADAVASLESSGRRLAPTVEREMAALERDYERQRRQLERQLEDGRWR